ncbi:MAG: hypothetical protein AB7Q23_03795 [Hyphomonadaceae bacterium]
MAVTLDAHQAERKNVDAWAAGEGSMRMAVIAALGALWLGACARAADAPLEGDMLVARGDYLVNGAVLCGDCHTPRSAAGELDLTRHLQGAVIGAGPPGFADVAPALAGRPANFTQEQIHRVLADGRAPGRIACASADAAVSFKR